MIQSYQIFDSPYVLVREVFSIFFARIVVKLKLPKQQ